MQVLDNDGLSYFYKNKVPLAVNITRQVTTEGESLTVDRTNADMLSAIRSGRGVIASYDPGVNHYTGSIVLIPAGGYGEFRQMYIGLNVVNDSDGELNDTNCIPYLALVVNGDSTVNDVSPEHPGIATYESLTLKQDKLEAGTNITINGSTISAKSYDPVSLSSTDDLNNITKPGFYYVIGGNSVKNKPADVDAFGVMVKRIAVGWYSQELTASDTRTDIVFTRSYNSSVPNGWTSWHSLYGTANPPANATTTSNGFMSASDKAHLDKLTDAYINSLIDTKLEALRNQT